MILKRKNRNKTVLPRVNFAPGFLCILMALELFKPETLSCQTVMLDNFYNHESHKTASGQIKPYHYLWEDTANTGFSIWGAILKKDGMQLKTLEEAPKAENLRRTQIYIIVDPDTKKENLAPNYIQKEASLVISEWVKAGGVLVLMANDSANTELPHLNQLAAEFGMHFNDDLQNHVSDDAHFEDGAVVPPDLTVFKTSKKIFMKDVCSISLSGNAKAELRSKNGAVIAASARFGKGTVFSVGDPWLYNEYVNGRLPAGFDNDKAASDLSLWLKQRILLSSARKQTLEN